VLRLVNVAELDSSKDEEREKREPISSLRRTRRLLLRQRAFLPFLCLFRYVSKHRRVTAVVYYNLPERDRTATGQLS
jgi:hypothetical protein